MAGEIATMSSNKITELELKMSHKEKAFADQYLVDHNGAQAAIRSGWSAHSAPSIACQLLQRDHIAEYIREKRQIMARNAGIDAAYVALSIKEIKDRCTQGVPVTEWDDTLQMMVPTGEWKFDASNALKATEMLGKHVGFFEKDNEQSRAQVAVIVNNNENSIGE